MQQLRNAVTLSTTVSDRPTWNQIACVGQWAGHPSGPFKLTPAHFAEMVDNFNATTNRRIPVDFDHCSEMDPREGSIPTQGAPAQAWILALDNRGAAGLWGLFDYLEPARSYVREGRYRFFSPTIRFNARDPKSGARNGCRLSSGALTNQPFLDGMQPLAASARASHKDEPPMIEFEALSTLADTYVENLVAAGHPVARARMLAMARAGREIAHAMAKPPSETDQLVNRVAEGTATIVTLADSIAKDKGVDRETAFAMAERALR